MTIASKKAGRELRGNEDFQENPKGGVILVNDNLESRAMIDACVTRHKTCLNPIIDWTDRDVWDFIRAEKIPYCGLYDEGFDRLGCIGCPMARKQGRQREFARWPKYKAMYLRVFQKMLTARIEHGRRTDWKTPEECFHWWMEDGVIPDQMDMFDEEP